MSGRWLRLALLVLAGNELLVGLWALALPRSFYADFPTGTGWVALLPPYNEHLVRDVGGLSLGFAVLLAAAALWPQPTLTRVAMLAWLTAAVPHLAFHLTHLHGFDPSDAFAQSAGLILAVIIPAWVLVHDLTVNRRTAVPGHPHQDTDGSPHKRV